MTTLEIVLAVACVVLMLLFIVLSIAASNLNEAYESMRRSAKHFEDQCNRRGSGR